MAPRRRGGHHESGDTDLLADAGVRGLSTADSTPQRLLELIDQRPVWIHVDWDVLGSGYIPAAYRIPEHVSVELILDTFQHTCSARFDGSAHSTTPVQRRRRSGSSPILTRVRLRSITMNTLPMIQSGIGARNAMRKASSE